MDGGTQTPASPLTRRQYQLWCALFLCVFALLSLAASAHKPLWRDEVFSLFVSRGSFARALAVAQGEQSGIVFYPLLHVWLRLSGQNPLAMRLLPLFFSLLAIAAMQMHAARWLPALAAARPSHQRATLVFSLGILSLNPVVLFYSFELRGYALFILCGALVVIATERVLSGARSWLWLLLPAAAVTIACNALGLVFVAADAAILGAVLCVRGQWRPVLAAAAVAFTLAAIFASDLGRMLAHASDLRQASWLSLDWRHTPLEWAGVYVPFNQWVRSKPPLQALALLTVPLSALGLHRALSRKEPSPPLRALALASLTAFVFVLLVLLLALFLAPVFFRRYLVGAVSPIAFLTVLGYFHPRLTPSWMRATAAVHVLLLAVVVTNLIRGVNDTDYTRLVGARLPVFTEEPWDILGCVHYSPSCTLVGKRRRAPASVGLRWVRTDVPENDGWQAVTADEFLALIRYEHLDEVTKLLQQRGYHLVSSESLGATSELCRWSRLAAP